MLGIEQFGQFNQEIQLQLPGNGLSHVVAELTLPHPLLDSRRQSFRQRDADLPRPSQRSEIAHSPWMSDLRSQKRFQLGCHLADIVQ